MKKKNIKYIVIFLLIIPTLIGVVLSCTNFDDKKYSKFDEPESEYTDSLYMPDTIDNRKEHIVRKTNVFTYICIFGLLSVFGITWVYAFNKKGS